MAKREIHAEDLLDLRGMDFADAGAVIDAHAQHHHDRAAQWIFELVTAIASSSYAQGLMDRVLDPNYTPRLTYSERLALVDALVALDRSAYAEGRLVAERIAMRVNEDDALVLRIAHIHCDAIASRHPLSPYLYLNSYWRQRVLAKIGDQEWVDAWNELLQAVKGFPVPSDGRSKTEAQFHHPANVPTIQELVRALFNRLVQLNKIDPASPVDRVPPPRKRIIVAKRGGHAAFVPSQEEDPPWWDLVIRVGGTTRTWCPSYRHRFEEFGSVPAMACRLGMYFDPPPAGNARSASRSNARKASPSSGRSRSRRITKSSPR